eukprot:Nitzschia sp. Nitz4//scaffold147_size54853//20822//21691//NITZ4_006615-RA/size54853-processed-gene-0.22-mRNA-1//-1//CDS//3329536687//7338//frame0
MMLSRGGRIATTSCLPNTGRRMFSKDAAREKVKRLRQVMQGDSGHVAASAGDGWETLWKEGLTPWDLGGPTKAMISEVASKNLAPTTALIPGCGTGYDLVSLGRYLDSLKDSASPPSTVVGLDISETSLRMAQEYLEATLERDGPTQTDILLCKGDFFASPTTWDTLYQTGSSSVPEQYDFIFDYTFFCAIPPELRPNFAPQVNQLLNTDGHLLTLMFPLTTKEKAEASKDVGPPYLMCVESYKEFMNAGDLYLETPEPYECDDTAHHRKGQELVGWWTKTDPSSSSKL